MSNWKDRARSDRSKKTGQKLNLNQTFEIRKNEEGVPCFSFYDKDMEDRVLISNPIVGIYVGKCMMIEGFSPELGRNGGTYRSSFYFTNEDKIALFAMGNKVFEGVPEACSNYINSANGSPKKRMVIFVQTKKGLNAIKTNVSIAIHQFKNIHEDTLVDKYIQVSPKVCDVDSPEMKEPMKYLGKLAKSNPPLYADVVVGAEIEDEVAVSFGMDEVMENFIKYKAKVTGGENPDSEDLSEEEQDREYLQEQADNTKRNIDAQTPTANVPEAPSFDDSDDDLPF